MPEGALKIVSSYQMMWSVRPPTMASWMAVVAGCCGWCPHQPLTILSAIMPDLQTPAT